MTQTLIPELDNPPSSQPPSSRPPSSRPEQKWGWHEYVGDSDLCERCDLPESRHRAPDSRRQRSSSYRPYEPRDKKRAEREYLWIGIDGEGQGRDDHKYVFLAAATEDRSRRWSIENPNGLSTVECLDLIMSLPDKNSAKIMSYSFNYDITKILKDLPDHLIYQLMRPELRQRRGKAALKGPKPVRWGRYTLNLQGTKFSIRTPEEGIRVVWDVWKFFQSKFVEALKLWKVGDKAVLDNMKMMKDLRNEFDKLNLQQVKDYCFDECSYMATLARRLYEAHITAGIKLKSYYGAGSSASGMLGKMEILKKIRPTPEPMRIPVAQAFFGGRFENSVIGKIAKPVMNWDISSAYPYQLCFLPCLEHAQWELTSSYEKMLKAPNALIHYTLPPGRGKTHSWGPYPYRESDGSICFPRVSGGGWIWKEEFLQGQKLFDGVVFKEAWIYHQECSCKPFADIPHYYLERLKIGKEGAGIVLKLACNSCYGKLAQSVGQARFNSWIWAGLITSGCRAQCLEMLNLHRKRENMLMMATDGIFTLEDISPPAPKNTGTDIEVLDQSTGKLVRKPLGAWEPTALKKGLFIARPGVYFPLDPTEEEIKTVRGRGVGKGVVLENWKAILETYEKNGWHPYAGEGKVCAQCGVRKHIDGKPVHGTVDVANVSRFCGAKSSISRSGKPGAYVYTRATRAPLQAALPGMEISAKEKRRRNAPAYGQWITRSVSMSFDPMPKRAGVGPDGVKLILREVDQTVESTPYKKALKHYLRTELKRERDWLMEQPDGDLSDYEIDDD